MHDLLSKETLVDETLTKAIGPVDRFVGDAIVGICNEAVEHVLGSAVIEALGHDRDRLALVAPWVWDLARGLHFQGRDGRPEMPTAELLSLLAPRLHDPQQIQRFAETIDLTTALTLDRLLDAVLGPGACARPPEENEAALPWLTPLKLGYRIHITPALIGLTSQGEAHGEADVRQGPTNLHQGDPVARGTNPDAPRGGNQTPTFGEFTEMISRIQPCNADGSTSSRSMRVIVHVTPQAGHIKVCGRCGDTDPPALAVRVTVPTYLCRYEPTTVRISGPPGLDK